MCVCVRVRLCVSACVCVCWGIAPVAVLKRYRVSAIYLDDTSCAARLRCRYPPLKLAPGNRVDVLIVLRGDAVGHAKGVVEVTAPPLPTPAPRLFTRLLSPCVGLL